MKNTPKSKSNTKELEQQVGELTQTLQRVQADFVNFKTRVEADGQRLVTLAKSEVISQLLPTLDNLERALAVVPKNLAKDAWAVGVAKSADQLKTDLAKLGLKRINTLKQEFDPELMEAVDATGEGDKEVVSQELQSGYKLDGQLLRHAIVKVERR